MNWKGRHERALQLLTEGGIAAARYSLLICGAA